MTTAIFIPHYNTPVQLEDLLKKIPEELHSQVLVVDDCSALLPKIPSEVQFIQHKIRRGYGGAQKTGYRWFLQSDHDQIILVHGDDQYDFQTLWDAKDSKFSVQLASRRLESYPEHYYPFWRKRGNQFLTGFANRLFQTQYTDLHTGGRIYTKQFLRSVPFTQFSDAFLFDQQILAFCLQNQIPIQEFPMIPKYDRGVSSISLRGSIEYGLGCVRVLLKARR